MAAFKCKMCGGNLEITEGTTVCECEYCGTKQTVPNADNEKKINLFNRANRLRNNCEFDKAASVYSSIVSEFPEEAEAYWGLCLCKYGIEYVDDPKTSRKIPTCHRTSFTSIFNEHDFDMACKKADSVAVQLYRSEAEEIDRLQKEILNIAKNEQPFDIFICYKESDENGQRTVDSELAHDLYDVLTEAGYKVFYARITLKAKLGQDYEPYIFSALNSSKVMLAVGTKFEYFNAVWVKNEWGRFLALMENDKKKTLIPCYRDIDAYDMPKEFNRLQAQNLNSPRAFQDLITNIEKYIPKSKVKQPNKSNAVQPASPASSTVDSLLKRAFLFIEDDEWNKAHKQFEKILDIDPENARAYLGNLYAELQVHSMSEIVSSGKQINENSSNYKNAVRFADEKLREELTECSKTLKYNQGIEKMSYAKTAEDYRTAKTLFLSASDFKDSKEKAEQCEEKISSLEIPQQQNITSGTMNVASQPYSPQQAAVQPVYIKPAKKSKKSVWIICSIILAIIVISIISSAIDDNKVDYVQIVKSTYFFADIYDNPPYSLLTVVNKYVTSTTWRQYESGGRQFVKFSGKLQGTGEKIEGIFTVTSIDNDEYSVSLYKIIMPDKSLTGDDAGSVLILLYDACYSGYDSLAQYLNEFS